jgi:hypothetical protein
MKKNNFEIFKMTKKCFVIITVLTVCSFSQTQVNRAVWMQKAKWGVMTHYLSDWKGQEFKEKIDVDKWNEMIDNFDVEGLAKQLESIGASYYLITIGQNSGFYLAPNETYDKLTGIKPSHCSKRDLVSDLYNALSKRGIKLMVYLPSGAPVGDLKADKALNWENGPYRNAEFQIKWEQIIEDWSKRWGNKVVGWWFDGCYWPNYMYRTKETPNFESFAAAARAGNPDCIVGFNPGVVYRTLSMTPYEDYTAGEIDIPEKISIRRQYEGKVDGVQIHVLSFLGEKWGIGNPRFNTDQILGYTKQVIDAEGAFTWDVPIQKNGLIAQMFLDQLASIGKVYPRK